MLHTPGLRSNLISVSKLSEKGANISFNNRFAFVTVKNDINIITATRLGQLYVVDMNKGLASAFTTQAKKTAVNFDTWHCRLGHAGADSIKELITKKLVDGLNTDGELMMKGRCEDCIFGKHSTHPFNNHGIREEEVLERVHLDIWGPARVKSAGGASYFMMIMDGFSSFRTVAFLNSKSADTTLRVFKTFHTEAERQTGKQLKRVRLDMGREWHNEAWEHYRKEQGLVFEFTAPYAHQQNGAAECSMRTILDITRSNMAESGLPLKYWADAVKTAVYVRNFIPSSRRPRVVPAEAWHGKRQDVSHLRPFGTTAYAHVPAELNTSKLHPKSLKVYLIGYYGHEAYKLLDRSTGEIFKSRDVIFEEGSTHYATQPTPTRFDEGDDPFTTKLPHQLEEITTDELKDNQRSDSLPMQGIAP